MDWVSCPTLIVSIYLVTLVALVKQSLNYEEKLIGKKKKCDLLISFAAESEGLDIKTFKDIKLRLHIHHSTILFAVLHIMFCDACVSVYTINSVGCVTHPHWYMILNKSDCIVSLVSVLNEQQNTASFLLGENCKV